MTEHDYEPVPGLPADLPQGERILWQGAPDRRALARHAFHVRAVALYFVAVLVWHGVSTGDSGIQGSQWLATLVPALLPAILGLGILHLLAWLNARSTLYTLTNRRVVMRFGVAIPMTVNIPFAQLEAADLREHGDGSGDLALRLGAAAKASYLVFWPHARPWHLGRVQPTLRAIAEPRQVAALLRDAAMGSTAPHTETVTPWVSSTP